MRGHEFTKSKLALCHNARELELDGGIADQFWDVFRERHEASGVTVDEVAGEV